MRHYGCKPAGRSIREVCVRPAPGFVGLAGAPALVMQYCKGRYAARQRLIQGV
jgi:hypothetical protein